MSKPRSTETLTAKEARALILKGKAWTGMRVEGVLSFHNDVKELQLPSGLEAEVLDLTGCPSANEALPNGLRCYELNLSQTSIRSLPDDLSVDSILNLSGCEELIELPKGLKVGTLILRGCSALETLPEGLDVWFLDMTGCWSFCRWPTLASIRSGRLTLRGCTALRSLPAYLGALAVLNVRDCPLLRELPDQLRITGWIDIAQSGLAECKKLPKSLQGVDMRWQGVRVEERILFRPETISIEEILQEQNAERRRVLLDRFGIPRFMQETKASLLDEDHDRGGTRQLLRVELKDDEPLVTLSCFCPSTARQYFLRVPPDMKLCHQAAAWVAGFDDPNQYQPILET
jgi:hypothetical protein